MDILKSLTIGGVGIVFIAFILSIVAAVMRKRKFIRELLFTIAALCLISVKINIFSGVLKIYTWCYHKIVQPQTSNILKGKHLQVQILVK